MVKYSVPRPTIEKDTLDRDGRRQVGVEVGLQLSAYRDKLNVGESMSHKAPTYIWA